jgi:hypothetical protein
VSRAHQCRIEFALDHSLDKFAHSITYLGFDRIETIVEQINGCSAAGCEESDFVPMLFMAWSPVRRTNAG